MSINLSEAWAPTPLLSTTQRTLLAVVDSPGASAGDVAREIRVVVDDVVAAMEILQANALGTVQRSLASSADSLILSAQGRATAQRWRGATQGERARALDAAVLSWLEPYDSPGTGVPGDDFRTNVRSWIFGIRAEEREVIHALDRLTRRNLVGASGSAEKHYMRVWLTTEGRDVLHDYDGDVRAWENHASGGGHTITAAYGGLVAVNSPGAVQTATITLSSGRADEIAEILETMRGLLSQLPPAPLVTEAEGVVREIQGEVVTRRDRNRLQQLALTLTGKAAQLSGVFATAAAGETAKSLVQHAGHVCSLLMS